MCIRDRLYVGDNGPDENVKIFADIQHQPRRIATFGEKGGAYAGPNAGRVGPLRFHGITGIGTDFFGNIYISESSESLDAGNGHGVVLESYNLWGKLNWSVNALEFVSTASVDPHSEHDLYDAYHHFKVDYNEKPGRQARYFADTFDRHKYPDDMRVTAPASTGQIQYIHGKKFLLVGNQSGVAMEMYRFEESSNQETNEIAIPCVAFDYGSFQGTAQDFAVQPLNGEFIWRDLNGDGRMSLDEFIEPPNDLHRDGAYFYVDTNGDVWQVNYQGEYPPYEPSIHLRRYVFQGFDSFGAPIYDFNHTVTYNVPNDFPQFTGISNAIFMPEESVGGTLYIAGNSTGTGNFTSLARYDGWDKGNRKPEWVSNVPWDPDPNNTWAPNSIAQAGDYLFADFWNPHYVVSFSKATGLYVGRFIPGNDVGGPAAAGNDDEWRSVTAFKRPNGDYVVIREEDYQAKQLMYLWTPDQKPPTPPSPTVPSNLAVTLADDQSVSLSWTGGSDALTFTVSRSATSGGPYAVVDSGIFLGEVTDVGLTNNQKYFYVVAAEANTGLVSPRSPEITAVPLPAGTTYEAENAVLAGGAYVVSPCPLCSGDARVGAVVQGSSITLDSVIVPIRGSYAFRIYDVNGNEPSDWGLPQEPTIEVTVNGTQTVTSPPLPFTGNWNTPGYTVVNVELQAGKNTIVLFVPSGASTGDPDIDRVVVPFAPIS